MLVLAFDTASPAVTTALADVSAVLEGGAAEPRFSRTTGYDVLAEHTIVDPRRHAELLAPGIDAVLTAAGRRPADLDAVITGVGPGPFTGLRVGLVTARTLSLALGIPAHGICTLDALAYAAGREDAYVVATDALRREVYWAAYEGLDRVDGPHVSTAAQVARTGPTVGAGAARYPDELGRMQRPELPSAAALIGYAATGRPLLPVRPLYLRRPDAAEPHAPKPVLT